MTPASGTFILEGGSGCGPETGGIALVTQDNFGVRYDLDPETGIIANREHDLYGHSVAGKVLVFAQPKGGVAASWALADLADRGIMPVALIFREVSPIFVQGCLFAGLPVMHQLQPDPCTTLQTGDYCELFPALGRVVVTRE
jgi:predicted aconitase with swiveling domain